MPLPPEPLISYSGSNPRSELCQAWLIASAKSMTKRSE
jgi:hypothetical protein